MQQSQNDMHNQRLTYQEYLEKTPSFMNMRHFVASLYP